MLTVERVVEILEVAGIEHADGVFTSEEGFSHLMRTPARTIRAWRAEEFGPRPRYIGKRVVYDIEEIVIWYNEKSFDCSMAR